MVDDLVVIQSKEVISVEEEQTKALTTIADSLQSLSTWLTQGGLTEVLSGYAKSNAVQGILQGLATHDGRDALDARTLDQNALEITKQVEAVWHKYQATLEAYMNGNVDPDLHSAEDPFNEWKAKQEVKE